MKKNERQLIHLIRRLEKRTSLLFCCLLLLLYYACSDSDTSSYNPNVPVQVNEIVPDSGTVAIPLVINGSNFGTDKSKIKVYFDDKEAVIITAQNEHLYVLNPKQSDGHHTVKVVVDKNEGALAKPFRYIVTSSVTTVAGSGEYEDIDGPALEAAFAGPDYLSVDDQGNILVTDYRHYKVKLVSQTDNKVTSLIDDEQIYGGCFSNDYTHFYVAIEDNVKLAHDYYRPGNWAHGLIINNNNDFSDYPCALAIDESDDIFAICYYGTFIKIDHSTHDIQILGNVPSFVNAAGDGYGVDYYMTYNPHDKHLYISTRFDHIIFRVDSRKANFAEEDFEIYAGRIGGTGFTNGPRTSATFYAPRGMDFDSEGNLYVADYNNNAIRKITPEGIVSTYAGGNPGHKDGVIEEAMFNGPADVSVSPEDFVYVADYKNYRIRCIAVQ